MRTMLKSKIHRATVTQAELHYVGSLTVDSELMKAGNLIAGEQIHVVDITNGARLVTYVIPGEAGSGAICVNGGGAHLMHPGDLIIIMSYALVDELEATRFESTVLFVDDNNHPIDEDTARGAVSPFAVEIPQA